MNEQYYIIKKNGKLVGVVSEKDLLDKKKWLFFENSENSSNLLIQKITNKEVKKMLKNKEIIFTNTAKDKEKLKEKLFILEMVSKVKEQLLLKDDMDLNLPEKAYQFFPQIEAELSKQGVQLENPLRKCVDDIDALSKFQNKLEKDKKVKERGFGRTLGGE